MEFAWDNLKFIAFYYIFRVTRLPSQISYQCYIENIFKFNILHWNQSEFYLQIVLQNVFAAHAVSVFYLFYFLLLLVLFLFFIFISIFLAPSAKFLLVVVPNDVEIYRIISQISSQLNREIQKWPTLSVSMWNIMLLYKCIHRKTFKIQFKFNFCPLVFSASFSLVVLALFGCYSTVILLGKIKQILYSPNGYFSGAKIL